MQWIQMGCQQMSFIKDNIVENSNIKSQIPLKCDFLMRRTIHSMFVVRKFLLFFWWAMVDVDYEKSSPHTVKSVALTHVE